MLPATGPIIGLFDDDAAFDHGVMGRRTTVSSPPSPTGSPRRATPALEFLGADALVDVVERHRSCEAEQQAEAITRYAYEYANEKLHDDVAALVVKVQTERAA